MQEKQERDFKIAIHFWNNELNLLWKNMSKLEKDYLNFKSQTN